MCTVLLSSLFFGKTFSQALKFEEADLKYTLIFEVYEWNTFAIFSNYKQSISFFQEVHNYKVNLKYANTHKVYLIIFVGALQILQAPYSTGATKH